MSEAVKPSGKFTISQAIDSLGVSKFTISIFLDVYKRQVLLYFPPIHPAVHRFPPRSSSSAGASDRAAAPFRVFAYVSPSLAAIRRKPGLRQGSLAAGLAVEDAVELFV